LYANVCFRADISKQHINQLIKTADSLTFRQFCILQLMNERYTESLNLNFKLRGLDRWEITILDIVAEIRDLQQRGLLNIPTTRDGGDNSAPIQLNKLSITKSGLFFCEILSLEEIEKTALDDLNRLTSIRE
jgi:DNA replication protein DnaD